MASNTYTYYDTDVVAGTTAGASGAGAEERARAFKMISPEQTPFFTAAPKKKAHSVNHQWLTDDLAAATANKALEGADHAGPGHVARKRYLNYTQILRKDIQVTGSQQASELAGGISREFAHQEMKAMKELKRDIEWTLFQESQAVGASGTARELNGIEAVIDNASTSSGQRSLTHTLFSAVAQSAWDDGAEVDVVYCGGASKVSLSKLVATAYGTRYIQSGDGGKVTQTVDLYEGEFGTYRVQKERYMATNKYVLLDSTYWEVAELRPYRMTKLPPNGDSERGMCLTELTLEYHPDAGGVLDDIT